MPRTGRGGRRQGQPGKAYPNRTDLNQPVRAVPSAQYGQRVAQERAQQQIPLPQVVPLTQPTQRPAEPVTAGLPVGPGPGPEALDVDPQTPAELLRVLYQQYPWPELRALLVDLGG